MLPKLTKYIPFKPLPKQLLFLKYNGLDAFYGGAAGGGKSVALLMAALQYVDVPGYNAILIRDTYANLVKPEGLLDLAHKWLAGSDTKWEGEAKQYRFPSGATVSFGYLDGPRDHFNYQGPAYQYVGIDEIVNIREHQALYLFSRLRKIKDLDVPVRFRCASNPPSREQIARGEWVKKRYVEELTRDDRVFIPARIDDNPYLDKDEYVKSLSNLDPITREQLLKGNWYINATGDFFDRSWLQIIDKSKVPDMKECSIVRYWDFASTEAKEGKEPAYTAGVKMALHKPTGRYFILNIHRFRESSARKEALVRQTADVDGKDTIIYIEQEPGSSGKDTISHYKRNILPEFAVKGDKASGSKTTRAMPYASAAERGDVYLVNGPWVADYLDEVELFPDGKFKDQVDASTGAYNILAVEKGTARIRVL